MFPPSSLALPCTKRLNLVRIVMSPGSGLKLRRLDVSYNSLRKVPSLALSRTERIGQLVLDGNLFLSLHPGTLRDINVINISVSEAVLVLARSFQLLLLGLTMTSR